MEDRIQGGVYRVGDNVTAFDIMPNRFKSSDKLDANSLAHAAFADYDPEFATQALAGVYKIIVAGKNFGGGGKTIEGPVFTLKGAGICLVIAESFSRYFLRNSINNAFPVLVCPGIAGVVKNGDEMEANLRTARIINITAGREFAGQPMSEGMLAILAEGGLVPYTKSLLSKTV